MESPKEIIKRRAKEWHDMQQLSDRLISLLNNASESEKVIGVPRELVKQLTDLIKKSA